METIQLILLLGFFLFSVNLAILNFIKFLQDKNEDLTLKELFVDVLYNAIASITFFWSLTEIIKTLR